MVTFLLLFTFLLAKAQSYMDAQLSYQEGSYDEALAKVEAALDQQDEDVRLQLLAGDIHAALAELDTFQSEHVRKAVRYYDEVLLQTAENTDAHLNAQLSQEKLWQNIVAQAANYDQQGRYEAALRQLQAAKMVLPQKEKTYLMAGKLAFGLKNYAVAEENFMYLIDSLNYDGRQLQVVLNSLLTVSLMEDSIAEAEQVLKTAQEMEGDSIQAQKMMVEIVISKGKIDYAEQWMDSLQLSQVARAKFYYEVGSQYHAKEELQQSISYLNKAVAANPDMADARYLMAINYQRMAQEILQSAETLQAVSDAQKQEAHTFLHKARTHLEKLQLSQPDYPLLNYTLNSVEETLERIS